MRYQSRRWLTTVEYGRNLDQTCLANRRDRRRRPTTAPDMERPREL
jgi:hypothetical protein